MHKTMGREAKSWAKQEKERKQQHLRMKERMKDNKRGQRKREREQMGERRRRLGVSRWKKSAELPFVCFPTFVLAKHRALRSPFRHTFLSRHYVLQKYNCGGWKD